MALEPWQGASKFSDEKHRWFITHALWPSAETSTRFRPLIGSLQGLCPSGIVWSGGVPVPLDFQHVLGDQHLETRP